MLNPTMLLAIGMQVLTKLFQLKHDHHSVPVLRCVCGLHVPGVRERACCRWQHADRCGGNRHVPELHGGTVRMHALQCTCMQICSGTTASYMLYNSIGAHSMVPGMLTRS